MDVPVAVLQESLTAAAAVSEACMEATAAALLRGTRIPTTVVEFWSSGSAPVKLEAPAVEAPFLAALQSLVGKAQVCAAWCG